jgi:hypothetical protein
MAKTGLQKDTMMDLPKDPLGVDDHEGWPKPTFDGASEERIIGSAKGSAYGVPVGADDNEGGLEGTFDGSLEGSSNGSTIYRRTL